MSGGARKNKEESSKTIKAGGLFPYIVVSTVGRQQRKPGEFGGGGGGGGYKE